MGKASAPPAPDYRAAAEATAQGNLEATRAATSANRINQYTPYGSLTYSHNAAMGPDSGWSQSINLSPVGQQLLNAQNQSSLGLAGLQGTALGQARDMINSNPFDQSKLPAMPINAGQTAQDAIMSRLQPTIDMQNQQFAQQMANQGIAAGSAAYDNAHRSLAQQQNDQYTQAALAGINAGEQARQQAIEQQGYYANAPLNYLNAIRSGSQVQNPNFSAVPQQQTTTGPNYLGAAQDQYNAALQATNIQNSNSGNFWGGLMQLGGSLGGAFLSDRRLKSNVVRVGLHPLGIGIYEYDIFGERRRGVMADEVEQVKPEAVITRADGFKMVNYGAL